jgi:Protein of unknown function (DUF1307).
MKKIGIVLIALLFITAGCGKKEEPVKTMKCSLSNSQNGMDFKSTYEVKHKGGDVLKIDTKEVMISDDEEGLETLAAQVRTLYSSFTKIDGYEADVNVTGDTLTSIVSINYETINTDELLKISPELKQIIKDGKVSVDDIKDIYIQLGATCD